MITAALRRTIERAGPRTQEERCELCAAELSDGHSHILDTGPRRPLCVCRACGLLFTQPGAARGHYRSIPDRREQVAGVDPSRLRVPVGLAFFVVSDGGAVLAHYPSPAGATRWEVDASDWQAVSEGCPALSTLLCEVEALLVNTSQGSREAWIVPVSDCYRLAGIVRQRWEGLSGGQRVWHAIDEFFDELRRIDGKHPGR